MKKLLALPVAAVAVAGLSIIPAPAVANGSSCDDIFAMMVEACDGDMGCMAWAMAEYDDCLEDQERKKEVGEGPGGGA